VMHDTGLVTFIEPFPVLRNQGMIWAADGQKMSKSKGNVVTPDAMVEKYGADALRLWELFMGPFEEATNWNEEGVVGTARYLNRVWSLVRRYVDAGCPQGTPSLQTLKRAHKTIRTVTDHIERLRFNTALAALMDQLNYIQKLAPNDLGRFALESYIVLLAPMAPHITEELWRALGRADSVHLESWPLYDPELTRDETVTVVVQVNGKVRDRLQLEAGTPEVEVRRLALQREAVTRHLGGKVPAKVIYVPDKLVSIVA
jgi:leucyl-tRNA synthetase